MMLPSTSSKMPHPIGVPFVCEKAVEQINPDNILLFQALSRHIAQGPNNLE